MSFYKTSDGVNIFYEINGEGKPIVFVHGWAQDHTSYAYQVEKLSKDYKIVTYDLRGHGQSERPEYGLTLNRFAGDLREMIDYLELDNILLVGWSMGVSTTFEYVKTHGMEKIKGLVLFDMTPKLINDEEWNMGLYNGEYTLKNALDDMTVMCNNFKEFAEPFFRRVAPYMEGEMISQAIEQLLINTPHVMYAMWLAMVNNDYRNILDKITVPTTIAHGMGKSLYSAETAQYLNSKIPNSKDVPFENCTHLLVMENPEKATEVIAEMAGKIWKDA